VPSVLERAIVARRVLRICYLDRDENLTERDVEPVVFMAGRSGWYLVGCAVALDRNELGPDPVNLTSAGVRSARLRRDALEPDQGR
jgi:WYL domain